MFIKEELHILEDKKPKPQAIQTRMGEWIYGSIKAQMEHNRCINGEIQINSDIYLSLKNH